MEALRQLGPSKTGDVAKLLPHLTQKQVRQALSNGKERGRCRLGQEGNGPTGALWVPLDEPEPDPEGPRGVLGWMGRVTSVWDLAKGIEC
jgi:hypothetical protein